MERPERTSVQPLTPLPYSPRKAEILLMWPGQARDVLLADCNDIIRDHRNLPKDCVVSSKTLRRPEFERMIKLYGIPKGYEKEFR